MGKSGWFLERAVCVDRALEKVGCRAWSASGWVSHQPSSALDIRADPLICTKAVETVLKISAAPVTELKPR